MMDSLVWFLLLLAGANSANILELTPGVQSNMVTVSGLNSGAAFASQFSVAHSSEVHGIGSVAGYTYYCAQGTPAGRDACVIGEGPLPAELVSDTHDFLNEFKIDPTVNLRDDYVYLLHGEQDQMMDPINLSHMYNYYLTLMPSSSIKDELKPELGHGWPTLNNGGPCNSNDNSSLYIRNCNYSAAYEMLSWLYQDDEAFQIPAPGAVPTGDFIEFDQTEFMPDGQSADSISLDDVGGLYVPLFCNFTGKNFTLDDNSTDVTNASCRLHVHFHGCELGRTTETEPGVSVGWDYASNTGLNQVADVNKLVIMYPQAIYHHNNPANLKGCWDYEGYNDSGEPELGDYVTVLGDQIIAVMSMVGRLTGEDHH